MRISIFDRKGLGDRQMKKRVNGRRSRCRRAGRSALLAAAFLWSLWFGAETVWAGAVSVGGSAAPWAMRQISAGRRFTHQGIHTAMVTPYDEVLVQRICQEREPDELHLVVSLRTRTLFLCSGSQVVTSFIAQVGMDSLSGDKARQGDNRTPRGEYYVCSKNPYSQYYLAFGLSYPNIKDAERGYENGLITAAQRDSIVQAIQAGRQPDWNTPLGGAIEIHGEKGGRTAGCVALGNPAMDALWPVVEVGCRVRIY